VELTQAIGQELASRSAILDGEIVRPGPDGRPMFYELMRRRGPFCFYAFDLVWLERIVLAQRILRVVARMTPEEREQSAAEFRKLLSGSLNLSMANS